MTGSGLDPAAGRSWPAAALALYPPDWRARYGSEAEALVADLRAGGRAPLPMMFDLFFGAVSAWGTAGRGVMMSLMSERSKDALIAVLWNWVAFAAIAAWFGHDLGIYPSAISARQIVVLNPAVPDVYHVLLVAGSIGVVATGLAALVFGFDAIRFAARTRSRRLFLLMSVPVVVAVAWLLGIALLPVDRSAGALAAAVGWLLLGVAGVAGSTQAVVSVVRSTEFPARTWRVGGVAAAAVTASMVAGLGATIVWGIEEQTSPIHSGDTSGWLVVTAVMAVATFRAVRALLRARTAAGPAEEPATA